MGAIGRLQRLQLRDVWKSEPANFTVWLKANIEQLAEVVGFELNNPASEEAVGTLAVDLLAEDNDGNVVVIENQLEKSDHKHLGQVLTYLAARDAKKAIWISSDPRPEHVSAVQWLNQSGLALFYMVKVEVVQIADSLPAPLFTLIVFPSEEMRQVGEAREQELERYTNRRKFWEQLLAKCRDRLPLFGNRSASKDYWISAGSGKGGIHYDFRILAHEMQICLYIDRSREENRAVFDQLLESKTSIEQAAGCPLDWVCRDDRKSCEVTRTLIAGGLKDPERWDSIQDSAIDAMAMLEVAFKPHIGKLRFGEGR